jgi:hypothetical protein
MTAAPGTYPKHEDESCWTHDYLLRHCEGYRVDSPGGHLGHVEEPVLSRDESETIGFLVRGTEGLVFVSVRQIRDFSPRGQRIVVDPLSLVRRALSRRGSQAGRSRRAARRKPLRSGRTPLTNVVQTGIRIDAPDAEALERHLRRFDPALADGGSDWCIELTDTANRGDEIEAAVRHSLQELGIPSTQMHVDRTSRTTVAHAPVDEPLGSGYDSGPVLEHEP